jgi:L-amino acid N-acyltransferase YncA
MLIRAADPGTDAGACAAIYAQFVRATAISFEEQPPGERELAARMQRISVTHPWLVAELDGTLAGYAYGSPHRDRASYRWATDVAVYVDPGQHRRGVGSELYGSLLGLLARQGFYVACAGITLPNSASVGLHESVGFTAVGVYRRIGFKLGTWWDVGWWQRQLHEPTPAPPPEPGPPAPLA